MNLPLLNDNQIAALAGDTLMVDTEFYPNYSLVAFQHPTGTIELEYPFDTHKLQWIMENFKTVGFYSNSFDLPMIWHCVFGAEQEILFKSVQDLIYANTFPYQLAKQYGFFIPQTDHIDLIEVCPLKGSLKLYAARLHAQRIQDLPFDPSKELAENEKLIVKDYCVNSDLPATRLIWDNLKEQMKLREELTEQYNIDLRSKSDAQIAESVIGAEVKRLTGKWPSKPGIDVRLQFIKYEAPAWIQFQTPLLKHVLNTVVEAQFRLDGTGSPMVPESVDNLVIKIGNSIYRMGIGGLHSSEKCIKHIASEEEMLIDIDFASYYPKILINNRFVPKHIGEDFLTVYKSLVERRLVAKKQKLSAIAEGLKITINGSFGKLGSHYSILYSPDLMLQVTITGQLCLLMFIEALEMSEIPVVSANTDGILVKCKKNQYELLKQIVKYIESVTGFETEETRYTATFSRDVNAYMAFKEDGTVKGKNSYFDPWTGGEKTHIFKFHRNPVNTVCIEAIEKLIKDKQPIKKTIEECKDFRKFISVRNVKGGAVKDGKYLGKVVRWYYAKDQNDCLRYKDSGNKVPDSDGAKACMILPIEFPLDIDYERYENETLKMLEEIGHTKKMTLFDLIGI